MSKKSRSGDSRLRIVHRIIEEEFKGILPLDSTVNNPTYFVKDNPQTTWREYLTYSLRHTFGLMTNQDVKYLPIVAKLAFSDEVGFEKRNDNGTEIASLLKIVRLLKADDKLYLVLKESFDTITFKSVSEGLKPITKWLDDIDAESANKVERKSEYKIVELKNFKEASKYREFCAKKSPLCFLENEGTWKQYTNQGKNRAYVCLVDRWKSIPEEATEDNPYDAYGTSMIFVFIDPDGNISTCNLRWNHGAKNDNGEDVDHVYSKTGLSRRVGIPFDEAFKPHTTEELRAMGYIPFNKVQGLLDDGVDPKELFEKVCAFHEGLMRVKLNGKWNFINREGRLRSNQWFDSVYNSEGDSARVKLNGKWNFINKECRLRSNQWFNYVGSFCDGFSAINLNNKWNFIDKEGKILSNQWFDAVAYFVDGFAWVKLNSKLNFINIAGELLSHQWFDSAGSFNNGFAMVKLNGKYNFLTKESKLLSTQWFDRVGDINDGLAWVELNRKYNFINAKGKLLSNQWFDGVGNFYDGFAGVELNGKWNFINKEGKLLSNQWFDYAAVFEDGYAQVKLNGKWNYVDKKGNILSTQRFKNAGSFNDGLAMVKLNGMYNFINTEGDPISKWWFDEAYNFNDGFAKVKLNNKWNLLTKEGNILSNQWFDGANE